MKLNGVLPIRVIENVWISMQDGCRLAAKIWLPEKADQEPVPAILEYIPYRKRDIKAVRDTQIHGYFAQHGYACVRVDLRGSGDSEGVLRDEYLPQELQDGLEILHWIAAQPWCTGNIGMFGLSWGGFNGLQIASLQPPELKAVITVCSSDDRYADDIHYMGGCLLTDNLSWASTMFAFNSCPPDPAIVGERWREMWLERLEGSGLWIKNWLEHQTRDDFWKHASVCEDFSAIKCPVFAVSGWADGYSNTVFRLLENLQAPRKGLVGAWGHKYPHMGGPGPAINFLGESLRWWDRWLKGIDTGVEQDPVLQVWMQDSVSPLLSKRPGKWVAEKTWPADLPTCEYALRPGFLSEDKTSNRVLTLQSPLSVGLFAGKWCSYSAATDLPWDQREEDGGALVFDSPPLKHDVEILGMPEVKLGISSNKPRAMIAVRLSDVGPHDRATRVTYGLLNLTHRNNHEHPEPLKVNHKYNIVIPLNHVAQRFPAGHKIRLSLSTSYWPLAWPSPEPVQLSVHLASSRLSLPVREPKELDHHLRDLGNAVSAPPPDTTLLAPAEREWTVKHNLANNRVSLNVINNDKRYRLYDIDLEVQRDVKEEYSYYNNNYDTVKGLVEGRRRFKRGDWEVLTITRTILTSTRSHFIVRATLDAYEGDSRVHSKSWEERISRNQV
ncbi:MAG: CocE/NonD family hydrolase [candidate division KSB1 bacterium]|nr:CocE/NonD family hydrolase [candidate division KSB1 bacterium]